MAWAALIPVALQLLKGEEKAPGPALPPPPALGSMFQKHGQPETQHTFPGVQPFNAGPVGGNRGQ